MSRSVLNPWETRVFSCAYTAVLAAVRILDRFPEFPRIPIVGATQGATGAGCGYGSSREGANCPMGERRRGPCPEGNQRSKETQGAFIEVLRCRHPRIPAEETISARHGPGGGQANARRTGAEGRT